MYHPLSTWSTYNLLCQSSASIYDLQDSVHFAQSHLHSSYALHNIPLETISESNHKQLNSPEDIIQILLSDQSFSAEIKDDTKSVLIFPPNNRCM